jgi:sugar lactone lactonase YvrE
MLLNTIKSFSLTISLLFTIVAFQCPAQNYTFQLSEVHYSTPRWTGVAVSGEGRIFVNFPRWSSIPFSVAEIVDSQLVPYPNTEWNTWGGTTPPENHFVCVQSVYIDKENFLWILDPASINGSVVAGGAKLLKIDLQADSIIQIIYFNNTIAPGQSYLNDIRVDTEEDVGYITESGIGALVVIDLTTGQSRRLLQNHYSVKAENIQLIINGQTVNFVVHSDGLALSNDGSYLYYKALTGYNLYRIKTEKLRDTTLTNTQLENEVEFVLETLPCDAMEFDADSNLYFTAIQDNAIYYLTPELEFELAVTDNRLKWPDSFSITSDDEIYVTSSRILFPPGNHGLFKITKTTTDVDEINIITPDKPQLYQNYPNPFNPSTNIRFDILTQTHIRLQVFNTLGILVKTLLDEMKDAGSYLITWNGKDSFENRVSSGIYFFRLLSRNYTQTQKAMLLQ